MLALPVVASAAGDICYLRDAAAPSANHMYLLCGQAMVYATTDAGAHWTMQRMVKAPDVRASANMTPEQRSQLILGATPDLHAISFSDDTHGIVVGNSGTIFTTSDGGKTWILRQDAKKQNYTKEHLVAVFTIGDQAWASGFDGAILHSSDGGATWEKQNGGPDTAAQTAVTSTSMFSSSAGGSVTTMDLEGIYFINPNLGWCVGWSGTILRTTDGGKHWEAINTDAASWSLNTVYFRDEKHGWATGFSGELLSSDDGGLTWKALKSNVQSEISSLTADKTGRLWAAADDKLIYSEDGGQTWTALAMSEHVNVFLEKVFGKGDSLWLLGELAIYKQNGSTTAWTRDDGFHPAGTFIASSLEEMSDSGSAPAAPATPTGK
jgi:photosystem II stability/assembly factor-like uncharacterized protein